MGEIVLTWNWFCVFLFVLLWAVICMRFLSKTVRLLLCPAMDQTYSIRFHLHNKFKTNTKLHSPFKWILSDHNIPQQLMMFNLLSLSHNSQFRFSSLLRLLRIFTFTLFVAPFTSFVWQNYSHFQLCHNDSQIIAYSNRKWESVDYIPFPKLLKTNKLWK